MKCAISRFSCREIPFREPVDYFTEHAGLYYSALLTGRGTPEVSGSSYIGLHPSLIIRYKDGIFETESGQGTHRSPGDFWETLRLILGSVNFSGFPYPLNMCGPLGYLSYDACRTVEKIVPSARESYVMPLFELVFYSRYIYFDMTGRRAWAMDLDYAGRGAIEGPRCGRSGTASVRNLKAECTREEYVTKVERIKEYIRDGDAYEVCLTQEFSGDFSGDPFPLFRSLYEKNPAPYSAYLNFRDFTALCNSPELFIRCTGRNAETRPIKGTAARGKDPAEDARVRERLMRSPKEGAELAMIVDLLRNDLGKVCRTGSVKVIDSRMIEAYENVFQLIGIVSGELEEGKDYTDLLRAVFPGGSITGCPKVRSMEIIEELETWRRNLYTGTIFIVNREMLRSNIVIRTAIVSGERIFINSGGAVTLDSVPDDEYAEVMVKVSNIMRAIGHGEDR